MPCPNPLDPSVCTVLNQALQYILETQELAQKCKKCGLPVEDYEAKLEQQRQFAESVKREFFPHNA